MSQTEDFKKPQLMQQDTLASAKVATQKDHELSIFQAIRIYPKAVAWSVILSAALIMDGYDFKLIGLLYAQPAFNERYGVLHDNGKYQITAAWQSGLTNGSNIGQIFGLYLVGLLTERLGFRKTMIFTLMATPPIIFLQFFAPNLPVFLVGQILLGMPLMIFQTVACVYAVEVAPTCLRGILTSWVSQNWVIGQVIASGVTRGTLNLAAPWAYRIPIAIQWFWPLPLLVAIIFAPESPWWFVRQGRLDEAERSLRRLTSSTDTDFDVDNQIKLMMVTTEHERELQSSTSYSACFKGTNLRRTLIAIGVYCMQIVSGTALRAYATYFFQQAGLATDQSFNMSIGTYAISFVGTVVAWFLMPHIGRRTFFLWGLGILTAIYFAIGGLGVPHSTPNLSWAIASLLLITGFIAYVCMIPIIFALVSEIPSSLLRSKTVAIGRGAYSILNIAANVLIPYQLNSTAWNWGAKSGFFWGVSSILGLIFTYYVVPEPKDRTVAELDLLFERKVSARKFARVQVNIADVHE